jgi:hypothetical protein
MALGVGEELSENLSEELERETVKRMCWRFKQEVQETRSIAVSSWWW